MTGMVFERYPGGGGELLLALALADNAHDDGTRIFPSVGTLAVKSRQSERSVQYQLRKMERIGWLEVVNEGGGRMKGYKSGGRPREYRISPFWINGGELAVAGDADEQPEDSKGANSAPFAKGAKQSGKGCKTTQERVQPEVEKGATAIAPEPRATQSNQEQPSHRECEREADPLSLTAGQVDAELAGFGVIPAGIDRQMLARFVRHRGAIRRVLSVQGWLQVRQLLLDLQAAGHDPTESLRQTMAAGLALPVIPVSPKSAGENHASHHVGSAGRTDQLHQQFLAERRSQGGGGGVGDAAGEVIDGVFSVVH